MGQKGHIMVQKGLKMHKKRQKIEFLDLKDLLFSGILLSGFGGYSPPPAPLNGQSLCSKKLSGKGGYPPPFVGVDVGVGVGVMLMMISSLMLVTRV